MSIAYGQVQGGLLTASNNSLSLTHSYINNDEVT